jgi:hypothetical protein
VIWLSEAPYARLAAIGASTHHQEITVIDRNIVLRAFYSIILGLAWTAVASANRVDDRVITAFIEQARIASPDTLSRFGASAAISGDTAVISLSARVIPNQPLGTVRVYVRSGNTWTEQAELMPNGPSAGTRFGTAVAINGDTAFISTISGIVYIFTRSNGAWTEVASLLRPDDDAIEFGRNLAVSGNTLLVASAGSGTYVYTGSGANWTLQTRLNTGTATATNGNRGGMEVSISGDTAVVGNGSEVSFAGGAFVFVRTGNTWALQAALTTPETTTTSRYGLAVAVSGDRVLVGAPNDRINNVSNTGAVYPFTRSAGVWTQGARLVLPNAAGGERFGRRLSMVNDTAIANNRLLRAAGNTWSLDSTLSTTDGALVIPDAVAMDASTLLMTRFNIAGYILADAAGSEAIFANGFE